MKLNIVGGAGLHKSELRAVDKMEKGLQDSWQAYAGIVIADSQGSMEIDCLIITHDRILIVELKEWNGKITSSNGIWYQNNRNRGKSPYQIKREHAQRIKNLLISEMESLLGYRLHVEAHVVLCGTATAENLPSSETEFIHTLDEFMQIRNGYESIVQSNGVANYFIKSGKERPNSERNLSYINRFFDGPNVEPKSLKVGSYIASKDVPWFTHRENLYNEFKAQDEKISTLGGLIRRWDFSQLGTKSALQSTWANIALRETNIGQYVRDQSVLPDYLLRSINSLSESDITEDTCEIYELRKTYSRLDEYLSVDLENWSKNTRIDIVRAILAPFDELHNLNIAHRDIALHNLWYAPESSTVLASGFAASYFDQKGTISEHRKLLQSSNINLPEDELFEQSELIDPFRIDVFLLALVAYEICFSTKLNNGDTPEWIKPEEDLFGGALNDWFEKSLQWDPKERFSDAGEMLSEFNKITSPEQEMKLEDDKVFNELMNSSLIKQDINPFNLLNIYPAYPGTESEAFSQLGSPSCKKRYLAIKDKSKISVKIWSSISIQKSTPGVNRRVQQFFSRLDDINSAKLPTQEFIDYGIMQGGGVFLVTNYVTGETLSDYIKNTDMELSNKINIAKEIIEVVDLFHSKNIYHGDLHPENIVVKENEETLNLILIDLLDYGSESPAFNTHYTPKNPSITDAFGRDRFAVYKIVKTIFGDDLSEVIKEEINRGLGDEDLIPISLKPLRNSIQDSQNPKKISSIEEDIKKPLELCWGSSKFPTNAKVLEPFEGNFYFNVKWGKGNNGGLLDCYLTGAKDSLQLKIDVEKRIITSVVFYENIPLSSVISASSKSTSLIKESISVKHGSLCEQHPIVDVILGLEPVIDMMVEKFSSHSDDPLPLTEEEKNSIEPSDIWKSLSETETDMRKTVSVEYGEIKEGSGGILVPYSTEGYDQLELDFDDKLLIYSGNFSEPFGEINTFESNENYLSIKVRFDSAINQLKPGSLLKIESIRSKSSRELRKKALDRVLNNKAIIPDLKNYFNPLSGLNRTELSNEPDIELLKEMYDESGKEINSRQLEAFQKLIKYGPIGVLQGPPGTGKTTFIAKFIHYLYEFESVKNILLVGQQHSAVDNVAIKVQELCIQKGNNLDIIRVGNESLIDERMLISHSRSLQRKSMHKFHREYDLRVKSLAKRLHLPESLVSEITRAYRTLSPLTSLYDQLALKYESKLNKLGVTTLNNQELERIDSEKKYFWEKIQKVVTKLLGNPIDELPKDTSLIFDKLNHVISARYSFNNPEKISRLKDVLLVSKEWLDVLGSGEAGYERFMLQTKQLVCGTLVGVGKPSLSIENSQFDWVIIDEAGRAQASELMVAMQSAKRVLLVGDHKQLPPFYHKEHLKLASKQLEVNADIFDESDFEKCFKACDGVTLNTQYRMIEPIGNLVSECFYASDIGKLYTGRGPSPDWYKKLPKPWDKGVTWIDSTSESGETKQNKSFINQIEIDSIISLLKKLTDKSVISNLEALVSTESPFPIGIIAMYRLQRDYIETHLSKEEWMTPLRHLIKIDTVDSYQGQENKIIILSLVRDNPDKIQGFLKDSSRINVAISRAQERLIILGAKEMWKQKYKSNSSLCDVLGYIEAQVQSESNDYQMINATTLLGADYE
ncbi:nuclease [Pseudoalteromonas sp. S3260]|uniref:AAA domain-containing protein n=3 Tax=Pseudoalteromonas TaxID=53246 RepID=UPI00110B81A5|nr:AAA domain-containing protein [Pseudoalteromonas sp. S3260]TMO99737.1 nuclease [Pseudoalteromonas sp. S3260]